MTYVAYYRVSTDKQERSGLGLEAQQKAIRDFLRGEQALVEEVTEVESGSDNDRPMLHKALGLCKKHKATLLIAKQDRLARRVAFVANLMESGVPFTVADNPNASPFELHIRACVDEEERRRISDRTRLALKACKERGKRLGFANPNRNDAKHASIKGNQTIKTKALERASNVIPIINEIKSTGVHTLSGIAEALNKRGIQTPRGGKWYAMSVRNVLARN